MSLTGSRKEYIISNNTLFPLKNYRSIFLKNLGNSKVKFGLFELTAGEKHTINTNNISVTEDIEIAFNNSPGRLYVEVIFSKDCK